MQPLLKIQNLAKILLMSYNLYFCVGLIRLTTNCRQGLTTNSGEKVEKLEIKLSDISNIKLLEFAITMIQEV